MAECSYARCVQERRAIKKELQRWTKNMVFVVGLERVAEELMGKRKWKQYQETVLRTSLKIDIEPESQDWEAQDKCSFCDGGMFLGSAPSPKSDSGSSSRSSFHETPPATLLENSSTTMTTLESVTSLAASLAAVAAYSANQNNSGNTPPSSLPFYPPPPHHHSGLFPPWYLSPPAPHLQPEPSDTPPAVMSLPATSSGSEQPLDLSAKAKEEIQNRVQTPQSLKVPSIDSKHIFKAKPRMSAVAGRRTYTEEELQAALRDIQSGKLGTRRAAVIYGIPRSTLRNKVYKLAMEKERDSHLVVPAIEEKDLSGGEEEKEVERALRRPLLSMEDLVRFSMLDGDALRALLEEAAAGQNRESGSSSPLPAFPNAGDLWRGLEHSALGPYISQLLASTVQGDTTKSEGGESLPKFPSPLLPELVRRMMAEEQHQKNKKNQTGGSLETRVLVNGTSNDDTIKTDDKGLSSKLTVPPSLIDVQVATANSADGGTEVDETLDPDAAASTSNVATPPNVILKIPSFKPTTKNGVSPSGSGCLASSDLPFQAVGGPAFPGQESSHTFSSSNNSGSESCSPPVANLSGKGIGVSLRDVIAKSISQKFQLQGELPLSQKLLLSADEQPLFKRGRFTPPPSVIKHNNNNSHVDDKNKQSSNNIKNNVISSNNSGKGTRPKRGKYRNYDRDSLVEAVRAVQRGEMSVHRAGSYYGVPHSTLEYKVKERHLMRPRKREPKQQLEDNRRKEDAGPTPLRSSGVPTINCDKLKLSPKPAKPPFTQPIPGAPNGLKIPPLFDPGLSPLAAYTNPAAPFSFWTPNPFHPLALPDLGGTAPGGFPPSPEQFFATQLLHRLPEESRGIPAARNPVAGVPMLGKSAREMAESLYDGTGANGSFLDGIIRSSLEMGLPPSGSPKEGSTGMGNSGKMSNKALIDQLCRNSCFPPLPKAPITSSSQDNSRMESSEQCADEELVKVLSPSDKTVESDTIVSAVVDLSQSSNGLPDSDSKVVNDNGATKCCLEETVVSKDTATHSPMANTKGLPTPNEEPRLLSNEVNSLHEKNVCTPTDDESACDSKTIKKIGDIEVAKDLDEEGEETADPEIEEDTKSKMINS